MITKALALALLLAANPAPESRTIRYIGNAGFEISDGRSTVLLDFPYESGAYGYMTFGDRELEPRPGSLCLVTHAHADHFASAAMQRIGCLVAGPAQAMGLVPESSRMQGQSPWSFDSAEARCIDSEHGDIDHCSFVLTWHGTTMVVAGDLETVEPLLEGLPAADLFVLPYWLASEAALVRGRFPGAKILLSHEEPGAEVGPCVGCLRLGQGDSIPW